MHDLDSTQAPASKLDSDGTTSPASPAEPLTPSHPLTAISNSLATVSTAIDHTRDTVFQSAATAAQTVGIAGNWVTQIAGKLGQDLGESLSQVQETTLRSASDCAAGLKELKLGETIAQVPKGLGSALGWVRLSPMLQKLTKTTPIDQWIAIIDRINLPQVTIHLQTIQQQHPGETPAALAHHLMVQKAIAVARQGLVNNLVPGSAKQLLGVEQVTLQAAAVELVYEIAGAYGLDLQVSDRQGEALAILGLCLGGSLAIDLGLSLVGGVPIAGALLNTSAGAALIYALGHGATQFYEAQLNASELDQKLDVLQEVLQAEGAEYLEKAIAQEVLMDWFFGHMLLAGTTGKTWTDLLPELTNAQLSSHSLTAIQAAIDHPPTPEELLQQLDRDFLIPLFARCQAVAELDGVLTPAEQQLLSQLAQVLESQPKKVLADRPATAATYPLEPVQTGSKIGGALLQTFQRLLVTEPVLDAGEIGYLVSLTDRMTGEEFEKFLAACFESSGYQVTLTPATNDFGADLVICKDDETTVVQAKRYQGKVGSFAVQEVVAAIKYYQADQALVVTNSQFTASAHELAIANGVALWERQQLIELILRSH